MFPYNDGFKAYGNLASSFNGTHFTEIILPNKYKTNNGMADGRNSFTNNKYLKHINLNGATMNHQDFRNFFSNNPLLESIDFTGYNKLIILFNISFEIFFFFSKVITLSIFILPPFGIF